MKSPRAAAILLAAGGSRRLGEPKQLVSFRGRPLVRHVAEELVASPFEPVVVVGAEATRVRAALDGLLLTVVENAAWETGMASSIRAGVAALGPAIEAALLVACDQPAVSVGLFRRTYETFERRPDGLVASAYGGVLGVPALVPRRLFGELLALEGDRGARGLLRTHAPEVSPVDFPEGALDVDTRADLDRLREDA